MYTLKFGIVMLIENNIMCYYMYIEFQTHESHETKVLRYIFIYAMYSGSGVGHTLET